MIVTIDTNVLFQAFDSRRGASHQIIRLMRTGDITMAISVPVFQEYRDALSREDNRRLGLDEEAIDTIMQFIAITGRPTNISYIWRPNLRDEGDNSGRIGSGQRKRVSHYAEYPGLHAGC